MNTSEYKESVALYNEIVYDLTKMYKELVFKGDFLTSIEYKHCLDLGIFLLHWLNTRFIRRIKIDRLSMLGGELQKGDVVVDTMLHC